MISSVACRCTHCLPAVIGRSRAPETNGVSFLEVHFGHPRISGAIGGRSCRNQQRFLGGRQDIAYGYYGSCIHEVVWMNFYAVMVLS